LISQHNNKDSDELQDVIDFQKTHLENKKMHVIHIIISK